MSEDGAKEVYFGEYCPRCKFNGRGENEYPCEECLDIGGRVGSHRPEYFEEENEH